MLYNVIYDTKVKDLNNKKKNCVLQKHVVRYIRLKTIAMPQHYLYFQFKHY